MHPVLTYTAVWKIPSGVSVLNQHYGEILRKRVELCKRGMGTSYLFHPENRVARLYRGPVRIQGGKQ